MAISSALWLHAGQIPNNNYMIDLLIPDEFENKILKQTYIYTKIGMQEVGSVKFPILEDYLLPVLQN